MSGKRVLVVDAGGRGNAIAHAFARSPVVSTVYVAPGNAGSEMLEKCRLASRHGRGPKSISELLDFVKKESIDLTFVGPEGYLSEGMVNVFQEAGQRIIGPKREAAILEGSKCFTKDLLKSLMVPVPPCQNFSDAAEAKEYARQYCAENPKKGLVIKADGLAAGKGSVVCGSSVEALSAIDRIMVNPRLFGPAGSKIEIEERLNGRELMFFALSDGRTVLPLESALDYKQAFASNEVVAIRLFNKLSGNPILDNNPNTGGMGGFSPHPWLDEELTEKIMRRIAVPTVRGFKEATGHEYAGVIYFGLMISEEKEPTVLEINVRLGDPEAEVILPRLKTDFYQLSQAIWDRELEAVELEWSQEFCLGICAISGRAIKPLSSGGEERPGYPGEHYTNMPISGLEKIDPDVLVYHNGTAFGADATGKHRLFTTGGRVLTLVARGDTLGEARSKAYENIKRIHFNGMRYRRDIGLGYV
ncbi:MAG: phosphoribosylamine--glycine ligase [Methanothrix sp.]|jgi:phosphoribosylamine--glycine ligase|nr:phosphoribosylamine--glycine ligase [Methanothrix sp.]OPY45725.1 MAG: phosphoribosylamine--glycine ligase [Methanosaeta sp. PtaU1.Bin016]